MIQYENKTAARLQIETLMSRRLLLNHIPVVPYQKVTIRPVPALILSSTVSFTVYHNLLIYLA